MNQPTDNTKSSKKKYHVKNWSEYNKALIKRGSLTLWISEDIKEWWHGKGHDIYSGKAIETMLNFQAAYHLTLRETTGFVRSIFQLMSIDLSVPDYSTISRRAKDLNVALRVTQKKITDMILDSTGLKVFGEGEWKVRKYGWSKRRTWKKIHIGIDSLGEIRAVAVTGNDTHDSSVVDDILSQEQAAINDFYGDGAFDTLKAYQLLLSRGITGIHIPPQKNAKIKDNSDHPRDNNLRAIQESTREQWKNSSGYHKRSLVETLMYRFKTTFGDHMSSRTDDRQKNEVLVKCNILNVFHSLGVPESYAVAQ